VYAQNAYIQNTYNANNNNNAYQPSSSYDRTVQNLPQYYPYSQPYAPTQTSSYAPPTNTYQPPTNTYRPANPPTTQYQPTTNVSKPPTTNGPKPPATQYPATNAYRPANPPTTQYQPTTNVSKPPATQYPAPVASNRPPGAQPAYPPTAQNPRPTNRPQIESRPPTGNNAPVANVGTGKKIYVVYDDKSIRSKFPSGSVTAELPGFEALTVEKEHVQNLPPRSKILYFVHFAHGKWEDIRNTSSFQKIKQDTSEKGSDLIIVVVDHASKIQSDSSWQFVFNDDFGTVVFIKYLEDGTIDTSSNYFSSSSNASELNNLKLYVNQGSVLGGTGIIRSQPEGLSASTIKIPFDRNQTKQPSPPKSKPAGNGGNLDAWTNFNQATAPEISPESPKSLESPETLDNRGSLYPQLQQFSNTQPAKPQPPAQARPNDWEFLQQNLASLADGKRNTEAKPTVTNVVAKPAPTTYKARDISNYPALYESEDTTKRFIYDRFANPSETVVKVLFKNDSPPYTNITSLIQNIKPTDSDLAASVENVLTAEPGDIIATHNRHKNELISLLDSFKKRYVNGNDTTDTAATGTKTDTKTDTAATGTKTDTKTDATAKTTKAPKVYKTKIYPSFIDDIVGLIDAKHEYLDIAINTPDEGYTQVLDIVPDTIMEQVLCLDFAQLERHWIEYDHIKLQLMALVAQQRVEILQNYLPMLIGRFNKAKFEILYSLHKLISKEIDNDAYDMHVEAFRGLVKQEFLLVGKEHLEVEFAIISVIDNPNAPRRFLSPFLLEMGNYFEYSLKQLSEQQVSRREEFTGNYMVNLKIPMLKKKRDEMVILYKLRSAFGQLGKRIYETIFKISNDPNIEKLFDESVPGGTYNRMQWEAKQVKLSKYMMDVMPGVYIMERLHTTLKYLPDINLLYQ
jgi:hypothetical protein